MVQDYNPSLGYAGFQEYQGSPREENIDGEPRVFRTYYGPSANRDAFLRYMFGATALIDLVGDDPTCVVGCTGPKTYPRENWICQKLIGGVLYSQMVQHEYFMEPFSYRCEPWDSNRSYTITNFETTGTLKTIGDNSDDLVPNVDCGVLIEIEYRIALLAWPPNIRAVGFVSTVNDDKPEYLPDAPVISRPTSVTIDHEYAIENRLLTGRHMEVVSFGDAGSRFPSAAAGENINGFTHDDAEPFTIVNQHTIEIVMRNVPYLNNYEDVRKIVGHVNNDVWFGYPAHAVFCFEVLPKPKYMPDGRVYYDVSYKFVARWVPAKGEEAGWVTPPAGPNTGTFVYNEKVGVWNRGWWEHPIPDTKNHWWPIVRSGTSVPSDHLTYDTEHNLVPEINFHLGFNWWESVCSEVED